MSALGTHGRGIAREGTRYLVVEKAELCESKTVRRWWNPEQLDPTFRLSASGIGEREQAGGYLVVDRETRKAWWKPTANLAAAYAVSLSGVGQHDWAGDST